MDDKMANWINNKLNELGWSQRELARRSGMSHTTVSKVMAGDMSPSWDFCAAVAGALGERPEKVFRIAGLLPPIEGPVELSTEEGELIRLYRAADPMMRPRILKVADDLAQPLVR